MIVINTSTRQFNIPGADMTFGVEADAGSERKYFQCPRYVGNNLDLMGCFVRLNYRNANGEVDSYLVEDMTVDGDNVLFSWELSPKVTAYKGQIRFVLCVVGPDTKVAWHTTLGTGVVLEGLEPDREMIQAGTADVVAALITMVGQQTGAVEAEGANQIKAVQTAAQAAQSDAVAQIEAKGVNVRESIPDDYTSLENTVDSLVRGRAGAIVCEVAGEAVAVNDASDMAMQGIRVFGRSTQNGSPTPDAPVEIKSVVEPVVTVTGKNLFNIETLRVTRQDDGNYLLPSYPKKPMIIFPNGYAGQMTVSGWIKYESTDNRGGYIMVQYTDGTDDRVGVINTSLDYQRYELTTRADKVIAEIDVSYGVGTVVTYFKDVQVEFGTTATTYEPYSGQTVELTHTLPGIPVTSGGNYTDSNGRQWISDEVDLERGVYVQRIYTLEIRGTESVVNVSGDYAVTLTNPAFDNQDRVQCLCNYFPAESRRTVRDIAKQTGALAVAANATYLRFVDNVNFTEVDVDAFKASLVEKHANGNPVVVNYILATPIETPLSETEIAAYRAMHTNYPNTTVLNDAGAHMVVKYAADTKLYIDNKIKEVLG